MAGKERGLIIKSHGQVPISVSAVVSEKLLYCGDIQSSVMQEEQCISVEYVVNNCCGIGDTIQGRDREEIDVEMG